MNQRMDFEMSLQKYSLFKPLPKIAQTVSLRSITWSSELKSKTTTFSHEQQRGF